MAQTQIFVSDHLNDHDPLNFRNEQRQNKTKTKTLRNIWQSHSSKSNIKMKLKTK